VNFIKVHHRYVLKYAIKSVRNVGPKSDHVERSDLAKRFFIAGWEKERAKREKQEGQGLKCPSVRLGTI
jgi:hypothetical protein